jgi:hypothetical protein
MVATGEFSGPVALLEPAFSREDEFNELAILDRIGRVSGLGHLAWVASLKTIGMAMKGELPPDRQDALVAEMKQSDPRFCRRMIRSVRATVVFCDRRRSPGKRSYSRSSAASRASSGS